MLFAEIENSGMFETLKFATCMFEFFSSNVEANQCSLFAVSFFVFFTDFYFFLGLIPTKLLN